MQVRIVAGTANRALAAAVAASLEKVPVVPEVERFPDGELRPAVTGLRGADVYVIQPTGPPVGDNLMELLLLCDACRRSGAARITALVPYFGYARQDRRTRPGEPVGVRVVADALVSAGAERIVVVDPHTVEFEAVCGVPVETLTAIPLLADALRPAPDSVVVAPDLGAVPIAERYAKLLSRPVAVVRKTRLSGASVLAGEVVGDVAGRPVIVVDDMISTGGTIEAAVEAVVAQGAAREIVVAATHGLFTGETVDRLARLGLRQLVVTDTLAQRDTPRLPLEVCSVAPLLAEAVRRLHRDEHRDDLLIRA
ncbi:ribose-phosphate diphosphokinase [Thermobispora bispora]|uniref:ribose-phosphate diphosphokinase n=1 Tax=Thermobispora bispora TaxID=2006 RepID=UPI001982344A|nr:ribose-phosphate pyrophosphokinase [Thermobispora bispora]QSI47486.1 ribose-phosphate pyrophosphokinase [Thermobispora bispora]